MAGPREGEVISMGRVSSTGEGLDAHNADTHMEIMKYMEENDMGSEQYGEAASAVCAKLDKAEGQ